jgi:hypothetical protein
MQAKPTTILAPIPNCNSYTISKITTTQAPASAPTRIHNPNPNHYLLKQLSKSSLQQVKIEPQNQQKKVVAEKVPQAEVVPLVAATEVNANRVPLPFFSLSSYLLCIIHLYHDK